MFNIGDIPIILFLTHHFINYLINMDFRKLNDHTLLILLNNSINNEEYEKSRLIQNEIDYREKRIKIELKKQLKIWE